MKIVFVTNFLNHHQLPLCEEFLKYADFKFVAMQKVPQNRLDMGYSDMNEQYPFVVKTYKGEDCSILVNEADAVIANGIESIPYIKQRLQNDKLTFIYSERLYKRGVLRRLNPRAYLYVKHLFLDYKKNKNFYVLCASAYTSFDLSLWGFPKEKCLKWGYFPRIETTFVKRNNPVLKLVWTGRFLKWKHPEKALIIAQYLEDNHIKYHLTMIGVGTLQKELEEKAKSLNISFTGSVHPDEVYKYMKKSDIFLFTSDFNEGWGAVLNEAMYEGCSCIASSAAGATYYLVSNNENGLIYDFRDDKDLIDKVMYLANHKNVREEMGEKAFYTIQNMWNAEVAVNRLIKLIESNFDLRLYTDGPCSLAEIIKPKQL